MLEMSGSTDRSCDRCVRPKRASRIRADWTFGNSRADRSIARSREETQGLRATATARVRQYRQNCNTRPLDRLAGTRRNRPHIVAIRVLHRSFAWHAIEAAVSSYWHNPNCEKRGILRRSLRNRIAYSAAPGSPDGVSRRCLTTKRHGKFGGERKRERDIWSTSLHAIGSPRMTDSK